MELKRLFFGYEVEAPWFSPMPKGRILAQENRHLTLAFLGEVSYEKLFQQLDEAPKFPFSVGAAGICLELIYLPKRRANALALNFKWLTQEALMLRFQQELVIWLQDKGYSAAHSTEQFLPHVTLARRPFDSLAWDETFYPIPLITTHLHLYESVGSMCYKPLWSRRVLSPIVRKDLSDDSQVVFSLKGCSYEDLWTHAWLALGFIWPEVVFEIVEGWRFENQKDAENKLNRILKTSGSPGSVTLKGLGLIQGGVLSCEMLVTKASSTWS